MRKTMIFCALLVVLTLLAPPVRAEKEDTRVTIPSLRDSIGSGLSNEQKKARKDGGTLYQYDYSYGDSCFELMQMLADEMIATGYFVQVGAQSYEDIGAMFWQMQYVGGGTLEPLAKTSRGDEYHVELGCYSYYFQPSYSYIAGMSISIADGISFGSGYSAPTPEVFSSEGAKVTVRDFSGFLEGTTLLKAERRDDGSSYYQYNYKYGDAVYSIISMYANDLKQSGLFSTVDVQRSGVSIFYYMAYTGPGADELKPLGTVDGEDYHVQFGCGNYNYMALLGQNLTFVNLILGKDIAMDDITWAEGYDPVEPGELEEVPGFTVKFRLVERPCPNCHGSGICSLCNGTGTYRMYGEEVNCDKVCAFCDGEKTYEAMEPYYDPN